MSGNVHYTSEDAKTFRAMIDAAPVAIQIVGPNGLFIDCNEYTVKMFKASAVTDIIGKPPAILSEEVQPDGKLSSVVSTHYIEQAIAGLSVTFEWTHIRLTGEAFPAQVTLTPLVYQNQKCLMASIIDLTEEKKLSRKIIESNDATVLMHGSSSGILAIDPEMRIIDNNAAFEKISGYPREKLLKMSMKDFHVISRTGAIAQDAINERVPKGGNLIAQFPSGIKHLQYLFIPVISDDNTISKLFEVFIDNTEMVNKIQESDTLIAGNPASIINTNLKGKILRVNKAFLELTNLPEEKLLTMSISDFSIVKREGGTIADLIQNKTEISGSMTVDFDSFIKVLKYRYVPVIDVNGNITSIILMYIDITDQLRKIDEITTLIQESPYGIITINSDLKIININRAFIEITGYSHEQGMNMSLKDFKIRERSGGNLEEVKKTGLPVGGKLVIDLPTGIKHLEYTYIPIKNLKGEIVRFFEIFSDITNLVNKINESEALIGASPASILTLNIEGKILSVNQAFIDICQIQREKLLTMNIREFSIIDRSGSTFADAISTKKVVKGRLTADFNKFLRILDFTYIPVLDVDGNISKIISTYIDLTEQIRMVNYLDESVEQISQSINQLACGDTQFTTRIIDADDSTQKAYENMVKISSALDVARDAVARLVKDTTSLADEAIAGKLSARADTTRHSGDYKKVIEGVNKTMESITSPLNEAMRVANAYAGYNFTTRVDSTTGMTGDWASFKIALDNIGKQVGDAVKKITAEVSNMSNNSSMANQNIVDIAQGAGQLAKNAGAVSANTERGKDGITQILRAMEDLSVTVGDVSQKTEEVANLSINSNELARNGTILAKKAEDGMKVITANAEETSRIITEIQLEMGQIGKIVRLITDIASQTNLLALNAAIEAARAGEAGRGFAVVAAEVKALATQSRSSAENIAEMIASLQKKSENASNAVGMATDAVLVGNTALTDTLTVFGQLAASVEEISQYMEQVASMSEEQAANAEEITASVTEVSDLMQETSNEAMNIAGVTEETSASLDQLQMIITNVSSDAKTVTDAVKKFSV